MKEAERQVTKEERYLVATGVHYEPLTEDRIEHLFRDCERDGGDHSTDDLHRVLLMLENTKLALKLACLDDAALRAEVARLTAENERLTKVVASVLAADQRTQEELKRCWRLDESELETVKEELAVTTERLAAADFIRYGNVNFQKSGMDCTWWGFRDHANYTEYLDGKGRATFDEAYQAAIAQGWLPADEAKGETG